MVTSYLLLRPSPAPDSSQFTTTHATKRGGAGSSGSQVDAVCAPSRAQAHTGFVKRAFEEGSGCWDRMLRCLTAVCAGAE